MIVECDRMDAEETMKLLTEAGVLAETSDGTVRRVGVTDGFEETVERTTDAIDETTVRSEAAEFLSVLPDPDGFLAVGESAMRIAALSVAIREYLDRAPPVSTLLVLDHLLDGYPRTAGTPEGFLSVRGDQLRAAVAMFPRVMLYVWRDDCDTCNVMRDDLESLFADRDPDVARLATFGPGSQAVLRERYDVYGAPTTIFVSDGVVQSRLVGAQHPETILAELGRLDAEIERETA